MLKLMGKKIFTILSCKISFISTFEIYLTFETTLSYSMMFQSSSPIIAKTRIVKKFLVLLSKHIKAA